MPARYIDEENGPFYHGTRYELRPGDLLTGEEAASHRNYEHVGRLPRWQSETGKPLYMSANPGQARWFAAGAHEPPGSERYGDSGRARVYEVEPTGPHFHDPENLGAGSEYGRMRHAGSRITDHPLRVVREHAPWSGDLNPVEESNYLGSPTGWGPDWDFSREEYEAFGAHQKQAEADQERLRKQGATREARMFQGNSPGPDTGFLDKLRVMAVSYEELDRHLEDWFHPQRLRAAVTRHPRSGYEVETGEELRMHQPRRGEGESPLYFHVLDHGDPHDPAHNSLLYPRETGQRPVEHVYRGVSAEELDQARKRGYVQSDQRGTIADWEGTNADPDPRTAVSYLPHGATGHILKIRVHPGDGWFSHEADGYARTRQPIPWSRVEAVSPPITKDQKYGAIERIGEREAALLGHFEASNPEDYRGPHQGPSADWGEAMHEVGSGGTYPTDFFERAHDYIAGDGPGTWDSYDKVYKSRGWPSRRVTMYRAMPSPHREVNTGDWVTSSAAYAREHGRQSNPDDDWPVVKFEARADQLRTDGNSINEWSYHGPKVNRALVHFSGGKNHRGKGPRGGRTDAAVQEHEPPEMNAGYNRQNAERRQRLRAEREQREAAVHVAELSDEEIHGGLGLPSAEEGHRDLQREQLKRATDKFDKLFLGDEDDWESYRLNVANENAMDLRRRYEGGSGTHGFSRNEGDEPGSETGSPYYEIRHRDERGRDTGWRIRHYNDGPLAEIEHAGTPGESHESIELPRSSYASNSPHEWFGHEHLHKMLHSWHAGTLDPDEPDENRKYLEGPHGEPGIRRWQRRHLGAAEHEVVAHFEEPEESPAPQADSPYDWADALRAIRYRKRGEPEMHRGMAVTLPPDLHDMVTDRFQGPAHRQARAIAEHLMAQGAGTHWTPNLGTARGFSEYEQKRQPGSLKVILHARLPEPEHIETDPAKLTEGAVFRHDNWMVGEKEIPLKEGAPVRLTGVTWYGTNNRKVRGDVHGMEHTAGLPAGEHDPEEAAMQVFAALVNPSNAAGVQAFGRHWNAEDSPETWYHGSPYAYHHMDPDQAADLERDMDEPSHTHWNNLLGSHFAAHEGTAANFVHSSSSGNYEGDRSPGYIYHAKLHIRNPRHYDSEFDMDREVYGHEFDRGNHPVTHDDFFEEEHEGDPSLGHHEDLRRQPESLEVPDRITGGTKHVDNRTRYMRWLSVHPDKAGIVSRYKARLEGAGHDGITYENEIEENDGGRGGLSAIAFHPRQVQVTQRHEYDPRRDMDYERAGNPFNCKRGEEAEWEEGHWPSHDQPELPFGEHEAAVVAHFDIPEGHPVNPPCRYCGDPLDEDDVDNGSSAHEECSQMRWCEPHQEFHDDPVETEQHNDTYTEWGVHLPFRGGIHRGLNKEFPAELHQVIHDDRRPVAERAEALRRHLDENPSDGMGLQRRLTPEERYGGTGHFGVHWTDSEPHARGWAEDDMYEGPRGSGPKPSVTHVVLHAASPAREHVEDDPEELERRHMYGFDHPRSEREVPLKVGAPVRLTGISWKHGGESEWNRHDFSSPQEHTAALGPEDREERNQALHPDAACPHCGEPASGDKGADALWFDLGEGGMPSSVARCNNCGETYHGDRSGEQLRVDREAAEMNHADYERNRVAGGELFSHFTEHPTHPAIGWDGARDLVSRWHNEEHQFRGPGNLRMPQDSPMARQIREHRFRRVLHDPAASRPVELPRPEGDITRMSAMIPPPEPAVHTAAYDWATDEGPFEWSEIGQRYPHLYGGGEHTDDEGEASEGEAIGDAAAHLYHDRPGHPYEESYGGLHPSYTDSGGMVFHPRTVDPSRIDYARSEPGDYRVRHAREGYESQQPERVPPLVLVHRHGVFQVADGHHRAEGAAKARKPVRAYVAYSPYEDEPFSDGERAPFHGASTEEPRALPDQHGVARHISYPGFPHTTERPRPMTHEAVVAHFSEDPEDAFSHRHQPYVASPRSGPELYEHLMTHHGVTHSPDSTKQPAQGFLLALHDKMHYGEYADHPQVQERTTPHQHESPEGRDPVLGSRTAGLPANFDLHDMWMHLRHDHGFRQEPGERSIAGTLQSQVVHDRLHEEGRADHDHDDGPASGAAVIAHFERSPVALDIAHDAVLAPCGPVEAVTGAIGLLASQRPEDAAEAVLLARSFPEVLTALRDALLRVHRALEDMPVHPDVPEALYEAARALTAGISDTERAVAGLPLEASWETPGGSPN